MGDRASGSPRHIQQPWPVLSQASDATRRLVDRGAVAPLINAFLATWAVKYAALPLLDAYTRALDTVFPACLRPFYDPSRDQTATLMGLSALVGYVVVAMGICTVLDGVPGLTRGLKTQGARSYFSRAEWLEATGMSLMNLAFFSWFATIPAWMLQSSGVLRGRTKLTSMDEDLHLPTALVHFALHGVIIDIWFFSTHMALHWPPLYRAVHKFHHRFKAPTAVACMYANPVEFCAGNVAGVVLGPALTNCHPYSAAFWFAFSLISTSMTHSGYRFFGADDHDRHHEHFDCNFGVGVFMDRLCGTTFGATRATKKLKI